MPDAGEGLLDTVEKARDTVENALDTTEHARDTTETTRDALVIGHRAGGEAQHDGFVSRLCMVQFRDRRESGSNASPSYTGSSNEWR